MGQAFFRSAFFIPTAVSYVVAALVWRFGFFSGTRFGLLNSLIRTFGGDAVNWLGGGDNLYWIALVTVRLWLQAGFYMILFIAGLQRIPPETYRGGSTRRGTRLADAASHHPPSAARHLAAVIMLLLIGAFQPSTSSTTCWAPSAPTRPTVVHRWYTCT